MRRLLFAPLLSSIVLSATAAQAADFNFNGYADLRLVVPPDDDRSWLDGGLGKLRYGRESSNLQFAGAVGEGSVAITPDLLAVAVARIENRSSAHSSMFWNPMCGIGRSPRRAGAGR